MLSSFKIEKAQKMTDSDVKAASQSLQSKPLSTDEVLLRIWCITNGWDAIIVAYLKEFGIATISALKQQDSESILKLIASMDWNTFCAPSYHLEFIEKIKELQSMEKVSVRYKSNRGYRSGGLSLYNVGKGRRSSRTKGGGGGYPVAPSMGGGGYQTKSLRTKSHFGMGFKRKSAPRREMTKSCSPQMNMYKVKGGRGAKKKRKSSSQNIGFSAGGAKDINSFRDNILKNGRIPQLESISFEVIFYDYYFETEENEIGDDIDDDYKNEGNNDDNKEELPLFYPSYMYSKSLIPQSLNTNKNKQTNDMIATDDNDNDEQCNEFDYFLTVGLNSNISEDDFIKKRKRLNLICVLDVSGSMGSRFGGSDLSNKSKMKIANECLLSILTNLKSSDRFGLILFDNNAWKQIDFKTMNQHKLNDLESILSFYENGGTNFESGFLSATKMFDDALKNDDISIDPSDENRIIFLTDACPNIGSSDPHSLMSMVQKSAISSSLYTTFVGIGLDFNSNLISKISKVRGANYFSVHSSADFHKKLSAEFDYFCFPMVFDLKLTLQSEGGQVCIQDVYGSNDIDMRSGEVMNI